MLDHAVRPSFQLVFLISIQTSSPSNAAVVPAPSDDGSQQVLSPLSFAGFSIILESLAIIPLW